jgi:hypothetical protein
LTIADVRSMDRLEADESQNVGARYVEGGAGGSGDVAGEVETCDFVWTTALSRKQRQVSRLSFLTGSLSVNWFKRKSRTHDAGSMEWK